MRLWESINLNFDEKGKILLWSKYSAHVGKQWGRKERAGNFTLSLLSACSTQIMVVFCSGEQEQQGNSPRKQYIGKSSWCDMKQMINVRKCSLGVATQFILPVGELTICTPIRILCNTCSLCCLKCSKVIAGSCRKTHPCSEFDLYIQNRV